MSHNATHRCNGIDGIDVSWLIVYFLTKIQSKNVTYHDVFKLIDKLE